MMPLVRLADQPVTRWRNGAGDTRELLVAQSNAAVGFDWRISIATIEASTAFSSFDGVDRSLVKLSGGTLSLTIDAGRYIVDTQKIARFSGEASTSAAIGDRGVSVLNIMTRRAVASHRVWIGHDYPRTLAVEEQIFAVALTPYSDEEFVLSSGDMAIPCPTFPRASDTCFAFISIVGIAPA
jgi:environmental stress-induced protein Ves